MAPLISEVEAWARRETTMGHEFGAEDLFTEFVIRLADEVHALKKNRKLIVEETEWRATCLAKEADAHGLNQLSNWSAFV